MSLNNKSFFQPLDRVAISLIALLALLTLLVLFQGNAIAPRVRDFSWRNKRVGAEDTAFYLNFTRPMNTKSVEANLQIDPSLPGKISWAGRKMAYTLLSPPAYGTTYQVQLNGAKDRFSPADDNTSIQSFKGVFSSRDRAFAYLGVEGEELGRLIVYNLTGQRKTILTPKDLVVGDFQPYPTGDKILFSATERFSDRSQGLPPSQLYTVTTGIAPDPTSKNNPPLGRVELILSSKDYQNLKFDLSADGKTILVQRVSKKNPGDFGLWILRNGTDNKPPKAQLLQSQPGGDFIITPDSSAVAVAQGQGVALLALQAATKPLDFLPKFGMVLNFAADGTKAAMVRFNSDYTRSLFLVDNQGEQKELLRTTGSINSCLFHPVLPNLYCMLTQLIEAEVYQEQPYLAAIDLNSGKQTPLIVMPEQRDVQISLSPDGLALLLDQIETNPNDSSPQINIPRTNDGEAIATSRLWLVPLFAPAVSTTSPSIQAEQLPLPGFHPRWLP